MGHNFGMKHDFDTSNGGEYGTCNLLKGIMSYANEKVMEWSTCSVNGLRGYYISQKWGETCLKGEHHRKLINFIFVLRQK